MLVKSFIVSVLNDFRLLFFIEHFLALLQPTYDNLRFQFLLWMYFGSILFSTRAFFFRKTKISYPLIIWWLIPKKSRPNFPLKITINIGQIYLSDSFVLQIFLFTSFVVVFVCIFIANFECIKDNIQCITLTFCLWLCTSTFLILFLVLIQQNYPTTVQQLAPRFHVILLR